LLRQQGIGIAPSFPLQQQQAFILPAQSTPIQRDGSLFHIMAALRTF
jgi:hypothetical protein